ncbi:MAG: RNA 2',3'-cyclic phosphodiesterase [Nitrospiraceae bacterium]|nr:RNA 2',3'-cyclic phosphodiesterase [Nitrospiraceae bacterium]
MRIFIAVELPKPVKQALQELSGRLRAKSERVSWVHPDRMHLTLRFLGDVGPEPLDALRERLRPAYAGRAPFTLCVEGAGVFPNRRRPSVVWAGIGPVEGPLAKIQAEAEDAARAIGLPAEKRAFRPHLTLARIRDPRAGAPLLARLDREPAFRAGEFLVDAVSLFSSELTRQGPIYRRVEEFSFDRD